MTTWLINPQSRRRSMVSHAFFNDAPRSVCDMFARDRGQVIEEWRTLPVPKCIQCCAILRDFYMSIAGSVPW